MSFDIAVFKEHFPEFVDTSPSVYTDSTTLFWAGIAELRLNSDRWSDLRDHGLELFVAHHIVVAKANRENTDIAGQAISLDGSKSVGDVSVSSDNQLVSEENGGNFNLTSYGRDFLRLARIVGSGGAFV